MVLSLLVEFIEGKWTDEEFLFILKDDIHLCEKIKKIYANSIGSLDYNVVTRIFELNLQDIGDKKLLVAIVERILSHEKINYRKKVRVLSGLTIDDVILPYLKGDFLAEKFVSENILYALPQVDKSKQKKYCKLQQKKIFKYKQYPPKWLQNGEWQYSDKGVPLVFSESYKIDDLSEVFVFIDPSNDAVIKVIQYL